MTPIQEFYENANILITGGTGFLGKVLIEKLLRSCSKLLKIYLIVRSKNGKDVPTRLEEIFQDVLFDRLKRQCPQFRRKIIGIAGNCSLPNMGLSSEDRKVLQDNVNIIFHVAATVRFDEKLKVATVINVQATKDIMQLAKEVQSLKSFMYVSTAYSNCNEKVIEEKTYKTAVPYDALLTLLDFPESILDEITPALLDKYPNTYVFTKQVAEGVISEYGKGLPVGILRPSVVVSTYREPISGWVSTMNGAIGLTTGISRGLIRAMYSDSTVTLNVVPADMVVNALIAACWEVGADFQKKTQSQAKVYNYESSISNPITNEYIEHRIYRNGTQFPSLRAIWNPNVIHCKSYYHMRLMTFLLHTIPAYLVDAVLICIGKEKMMVKLYTKIHNIMDQLGYFTTKNFYFKSKNVATMLSKMSLRDRQIFFCDLSAFSWDEYFINYFKGIRVYLLHDPLDTLPDGLAKARRLYWYHQILKVVLATLLMSILSNVFF